MSAAMLWPSWPASSSYVTAVGATRFFQDNATAAVEAAVSAKNHFGSGGGFSPWTYLEQPENQAVKQYIATATGQPDPPRTSARSVPRAR